MSISVIVSFVCTDLTHDAPGATDDSTAADVDAGLMSSG